MPNEVPKRQTYLPYGRQCLDDEDIEQVIGVLKSPMITQGPLIEEFEQAIANYAGTKYAVAFSNGTAALHGAYYAAGITKGDEIITTPMTFVATTNAALYLGARPVFSDIDSQTYNLDPLQIEEKITSRTKAIVSVDFTGQPVDYDSIRKIADYHKLVYISDGAHSLGAKYKGEPVGKQADMTMFSFHPVKPITTGEGGIIVTNNEKYSEKLRLFRSHGIVKNDDKNKDQPWFYEMIDLGMNYRMTDIQAALGLSQLKKINYFIERRNEIASQYNQAFKSLDKVTIPSKLEVVKSGYHLYVLSLNLSKLESSREEIFRFLRRKGIGVHVHYIPVYKHPYYQSIGYSSDRCVNAEKLYDMMITLPIFPKMTDEDVLDVVRVVTSIF
ncbi:UDP-4-amino-4,6-dideoxy-N-acetyl-beta-L-altrosamine transaminase [Gracilibacillus lacisalsi]|uniref:UDP-4-amino-4, 6-dideoxy-N-acetyl-beta-L-altrosamine transaminase n=1 Tax=Gracilibacillus lacisalsi TaxID=393087 RepID=UPI0004759A02|nr:UDP-4-amino-4,6-dideoxy-N-acetyl-beta-L-altrosamine transaminase [Gracilibacillus lacisalsi]